MRTRYLQQILWCYRSLQLNCTVSSAKTSVLLSCDIFYFYSTCHFLFPVLACRCVVQLVRSVSFAVFRFEFGKQSCSFGECVGSARSSLECSARRVLIGGCGVWGPVMLVHFSFEPLHSPLPA